MRRGEVWTLSGRSFYAGKPRPAVIVQSDLYDVLESVTLCGLTSTSSPSPISRPLIQPRRENGLLSPSRAMIDKVTTVPSQRLGKRVGRLSKQEMAQIEAALVVFLGLPVTAEAPLTSEGAPD